MTSLIKIFFLTVVVIITTIITLKSNKTPKASVTMKQKAYTNITSFDLNVFIQRPGSDFKEKWIKELEKYGLKLEIHPDFNINNQSGFLPFKLIVSEDTKYVKSKKYSNKTILTGYELDISEFDHKDYFSFFEKEELKQLPREYVEKMKKAKLNFYFSISPSQNTSEYRMAWFSAAVLTQLYDGVLSNPQEGTEYMGQEAIDKAIESSNIFESSISDNAWKLHEFKKWN